MPNLCIQQNKTDAGDEVPNLANWEYDKDCKTHKTYYIHRPSGWHKLPGEGDTPSGNSRGKYLWHCGDC